MDYSIGSVADLISGSTTPNKQKVVKKKFQLERKSLDNKNQEDYENKSPNKRKSKSPTKHGQNEEQISPKKVKEIKKTQENGKKRLSKSPKKIKQIEEDEDNLGQSDEDISAVDLADLFKSNVAENDDSDDEEMKEEESKKSPKGKRKSSDNLYKQEIVAEAKKSKKEKKKLHKKQILNAFDAIDLGLASLLKSNMAEDDSDHDEMKEEKSKESPKGKRKSSDNLNNQELVSEKKKSKKEKKKLQKKQITNEKDSDASDVDIDDLEDLFKSDIPENDDDDDDDMKDKKSKKNSKRKRKSSDNLNEEETVPETKKSKKIQKKNSNDEIDTNNESPEEKNPNDVMLFVGNLPISMTKQKLKKLFVKFGNVKNARIRSIPIADPKIPKKVAAIKKDFHPNRTSVNGYVTFTERASAEKALSYNGKEYKGHHLRVNIDKETQNLDKDKAIFLGNVSFDAEEEELWSLFKSCGEIESVRLVRDKRTDVGKGFGYVNFKSPDSVELALQMGEVKLKDRVLRISVYNSKAPRKVKKEGVKRAENTNDKRDKRKKMFLNKKAGGKEVNEGKGEFQGRVATMGKKKKFNKGNQQKKKLAEKIAPKSISN